MATAPKENSKIKKTEKKTMAHNQTNTVQKQGGRKKYKPQKTGPKFGLP